MAGRNAEEFKDPERLLAKDPAELSATDLKKCRVADLKKAAAVRELSQGGNKAALVDRLLAWFERQTESESEDATSASSESDSE